jgi:hypothetical protein
MPLVRRLIVAPFVDPQLSVVNIVTCQTVRAWNYACRRHELWLQHDGHRSLGTWLFHKVFEGLAHKA